MGEVEKESPHLMNVYSTSDIHKNYLKIHGAEPHVLFPLSCSPVQSLFGGHILLRTAK